MQQQNLRGTYVYGYVVRQAIVAHSRAVGPHDFVRATVFVASVTRPSLGNCKLIRGWGLGRRLTVNRPTSFIDQSRGV